MKKILLRLIYLKHSTFHSLKITVHTLIDVTRNETWKHHVKNQLKYEHITLLSDVNIAVCFSWPQLTANCIAVKTWRLWHYIKLIWETPTTEDANFHRHKLCFHSKLDPPNKMASRLTTTTSFPRIFSQLLQYLTQRPSFSAHRAALWWQKLTWLFQHFAAQFCFCYKFSFHKEWRLSQVWQWRDFPQPITIFCYA